jgi:hypothetical protein
MFQSRADSKASSTGRLATAGPYIGVRPGAPVTAIDQRLRLRVKRLRYGSEVYRPILWQLVGMTSSCA